MTSADGARVVFSACDLTGAFLAEAATTLDNKLNVSGGVLSRFVVGPDRWVRLVLVVLTRGDSSADGSDSGRWVDIEIKPPTLDDPVRQPFQVPENRSVNSPVMPFLTSRRSCLSMAAGRSR